MLMTEIETLGEVCPISVVVEIPEQLHGSVVRFTESSDWSFDDVVQEALNLFLLSQKKGDPKSSIAPSVERDARVARYDRALRVVVANRLSGGNEWL